MCRLATGLCFKDRVVRRLHRRANITERLHAPGWHSSPHTEAAIPGTSPYETTSSTRENDAIEKGDEHARDEVAADVTHAGYSAHFVNK